MLYYMGMGLVSVFLGLLFALFDAAAKDRNFTISAMLMGLLGVFWANVALHTSLVSNGVVLSRYNRQFIYFDICSPV